MIKTQLLDFLKKHFKKSNVLFVEGFKVEGCRSRGRSRLTFLIQMGYDLSGEGLKRLLDKKRGSKRDVQGFRCLALGSWFS